MWPTLRLGLALAIVLVLGLTQPISAGAPDPTSGGVRGIEWAKSKVTQDAGLAALKQARAASLAEHAPRADPVLDTTVTQYVIEPEGSDYDDTSPTRQPYNDGNYWYFCTAGAVAASMYYWRPSLVTSWPAQAFIEPPSATTRISTFWAAADYDGLSPNYYTRERNYLMYIAEQVQPPSYTSGPGEVTFAGSNVYGTLPDMRDAMNWEASGHAQNWNGYFYYSVVASDLTQTTLHNDIVTDVYVDSAPVLVVTKTSALPNWSNPNVIHAISIVGYDDTANPPTYTYLDTCGVRCGSSSNGGVHTVNQAALYQGILAAGATIGGIVY